MLCFSKSCCLNPQQDPYTSLSCLTKEDIVFHTNCGPSISCDEVDDVKSNPLCDEAVQPLKVIFWSWYIGVIYISVRMFSVLLYFWLRHVAWCLLRNLGTNVVVLKKLKTLDIKIACCLWNLKKSNLLDPHQMCHLSIFLKCAFFPLSRPVSCHFGSVCSIKETKKEWMDAFDCKEWDYLQ